MGMPCVFFLGGPNKQPSNSLRISTKYDPEDPSTPLLQRVHEAHHAGAKTAAGQVEHDERRVGAESA